MHLNLFSRKELQTINTKDILDKKWKQWKRVWEVSFEIGQSNYSTVKIS